jgi:hypothetical protein
MKLVFSGTVRPHKQREICKVQKKLSGRQLFFIAILPVLIIVIFYTVIIVTTPAEQKQRYQQEAALKRDLAQKMWQQQQEQIAANQYAQEGAKWQPKDQFPEVDVKKYFILKLDYRFFAIPREYGDSHWISFYWPKNMQKIYRGAVSGEKNFNDSRRKSSITIFLQSSHSWGGHFLNKKALDLSDESTCYQPIGALKSWSGLYLFMRFDDSHIKDWPQICLEIRRILTQEVKEVTHHD